MDAAGGENVGIRLRWCSPAVLAGFGRGRNFGFAVFQDGGGFVRAPMLAMGVAPGGCGPDSAELGPIGPGPPDEPKAQNSVLEHQVPIQLQGFIVYT